MRRWYFVGLLVASACGDASAPRDDGSISGECEVTTAACVDAGGEAGSAPGDSTGGPAAAGTTGAGADAAVLTDGEAGHEGGQGSTAGLEGGPDGGPGASQPTACEPGTGDTEWAASCDATTTPCAGGAWQAPETGSDGHPLRAESEHFALYWHASDPDGGGPLRGLASPPSQATIDQAFATLESLWDSYFGPPISFPEPYCGQSVRWKAAVHVDDYYPLWGGGFGGDKMGLWIGLGALMDHWGLAHEFMHGVQSTTQAFPDCGGVGCWIFESHANWMPHQVYRDNAHCSHLLVEAPHLYYGNTRDRYCNWQFFEFLKDRHCHSAVNDMWAYEAPAGQRDPFQKLMLSRGWDVERLNDEFGLWALHNVTWDYRDPDGHDQGSVYRSTYGSMSEAGDLAERHNRLTRLEPLDDSWPDHRRFVSPYYWAPQRWGYNIIELAPEPGASEVGVRFRGVVQDGAHSGWRWGLLATDPDMSEARYGSLQAGSDGEASLCIQPGERVFLVVTATPTEYIKIPWTNPADGPAYPSLYRYPYMVQLSGAWPSTHADGTVAACPPGTQRHDNGGGCATPGTSASVYVGPHARVLGGSVSGGARIEDHATIVRGDITGGTIGGLTIVGTQRASFGVSGSADVRTTFLPLGWFGGVSIGGDATLVGDAEYNTNVSSGFHYGLVDGSARQPVQEVTVAPPYTWRP